jgi:hypothetical protein
MKVKISEIIAERDRSIYGLLNTLPFVLVMLVMIPVAMHFVPENLQLQIFFSISSICILAILVTRVFNNSVLIINEHGVFCQKSKTIFMWNDIENIEFFKIDIGSFRPYFLLIIYSSNVKRKIIVDDYFFFFAEKKIGIIEQALKMYSGEKYDLSLKRGGIELLPPN